MYGEKIVGPKGHVRHAGTTHKRNNASNISHPTGMQAYSGARRNKLKKELDAREDKVRPRKKKVPKAIPTIKARSGPTKRRPTREEQLKDSGVSIDYNQLDNMKHGGKVKPKRRKRKPFEPYVTMEAKGGGKVEYKKHGGKVIKTNMSGDDVVRGCYD